jgi:hypothetical protein
MDSTPHGHATHRAAHLKRGRGGGSSGISARTAAVCSVPADPRESTDAAARRGCEARHFAAASADADERVRQLEARVAELEASERKLATERDILRKAAKYVAEETNWWPAAASSSTTTGTPTR